MSELREVLLSRVHPNPFRDIDNYPFWRDKLDRLKESMKSTFAWPNIIVRQRKDGDYELAFGHHRVQAMRELELKKISVIIEPLSDDQMLKMMADENAEEFGTNFALGTMNAVSAVVKAFGAGTIKLLRPEDNLRDSVARSAPSFVQGQDLTPGLAYNANTVGQYLGWIKVDSDGRIRPQGRVLTALAALELIELGVCKPNAFQGLGHEQARAVVSQAQLVYKARMKELDRKAEEKEVRAAQKEATKEAAKVVQRVVGQLKDGAGVREIRDETSKIRQQVATVPTQKKEDPRGLDVSRMMDKAAEEVEKQRMTFVAWTEKVENLMKAFNAGAICDKQVQRRFGSELTQFEKALGRFTQSFSKAQEKRG